MKVEFKGGEQFQMNCAHKTDKPHSKCMISNPLSHLIRAAWFSSCAAQAVVKYCTDNSKLASVFTQDT